MSADPSSPATPSLDLELEVYTGEATGTGTLHAPDGPREWQNPEALLGSVLDRRYLLVRLIGQGGMGAVYQATHVVIGKTIAVKVLSPNYSRNPGDVQRFLQEARAASLIRHDHVVDIADFGYTEHGQAYLVMEHLAGEDLAHTLQREGRMGWFRVSNIVLQIGSALSAAHAKGIIHRDMKPENCFRVKRDGDEDFIKVLDFGIAKIVDGRLATGPHLSLTIEGGIIGTPEYIAPELCRGQKADARVDIYALGVVMYRLLTGLVPFTAENGNYMAVLSQHLTTPPTPPREVAPDAAIPPKIEQIVLRALEKDPDDRYQTVDELVAALRDAQLTLTGASSTAILSGVRTIRPRPAGRARSSARMPPGLFLALAFVLLVGGAAIVWALIGGDLPEDSALPPLVRPPPAAVAPPDPPAPRPDTNTSGGSSGEAPDVADTPTPGRLPATLSAAEFKKTAAQIQRSLRGKCSALPGMTVGARVTVEPDGKVSRVVPEGSQAGSSLAVCVINRVRMTRFKKAQKASTHAATFKF